MERLPEHFEEDDTLRKDICEQESYDEYTSRVCKIDGDGSELGRHAAKALNVYGVCDEEFDKALEDDWQETLVLGTTFNETLYLAGHTSLQARMEVVERTQAQLLNAAVQRGWFGTGTTNN